MEELAIAVVGAGLVLVVGVAWIAAAGREVTAAGRPSGEGILEHSGNTGLRKGASSAAPRWHQSIPILAAH